MSVRCGFQFQVQVRCRNSKSFAEQLHASTLSQPLFRLLLQGVSDPLMDYCAPASQEGDPPQGQWAHYVLRSSFGGSDSTFVVQGSEDGQVGSCG